MRSNEEFRKLIDDKHKSLIQKRRQNKNKAIGFLSCLVAFVLVFTIFISNDGFRKIWGFDSDFVISDNSTSDSNSTTSSDKDTLQNEKNESNVSSNQNNESSNIQSSYDDSESSFGQSFSPVPDNSHESSEQNSSSDDTFSPDNNYPPFANLDYVIVPDDFPNITKTENLMQFITPTKKPDESLPSDDVSGDDTSDVASDPWDSDVSSDEVSSDETPDKIPDDKTNPFDDTETQYGIADFGFELFKNTYISNQNNLLAPTATLYSLAMLTNGAHGNTQDQLVDNLCGTSLDRMNEYLCEYRTVFGQSEYYNVSLNSAVWYDDSVTIDKNFLQTNCDYYGMEAYKSIFGTQDALDSINGWIQEKTNGKTSDIIDEFRTNAPAIITNSLHFETGWAGGLTSIGKKTFTNATGEKKLVEMMKNIKQYYYLENDISTGFVYKSSYAGKPYKFVALRPNDGITVDELINSLNATTYFDLMNNQILTTMKITMPKFSITSENELSDAIKAIGITDAFDSENADFSRMGVCENNTLFLDTVAQKITLSVHERGTLDATSSIYGDGSTQYNPDVAINLNRPFVYMFIDAQTKLPLLIGTVEDFE